MSTQSNFHNAPETRITAANPAGVVILLDVSGSMCAEMASGEGRCADVVAATTNDLLQTCVMLSRKGDALRDLWHIGVFGFGGDHIVPMLPAPLDSLDLHPISRIAECHHRIDGQLGRPVWVEPRANGGTPMREGIEHAHRALQQWFAANPEAALLSLVVLSDGCPNSGDPGPAAEAVRSLKTRFEPAMLLGVGINHTTTTPILFPGSEVALPDEHAELIQSLASPLTPQLRHALARLGYEVAEDSRAAIHNAGDAAQIFEAFAVGTRTMPVR